MDTRTPDELLNDTLLVFTQTIGEALDDMCSYGLTYGETYVPFDPDPEDGCKDYDPDEPESMVCSQAWVRVTGITVVPDEDPMDDDFGALRTARFEIGLEVGVLRCVEIREDGEAPYASDVLVAATQSMTDMRAIYCAAMEKEIWESIEVGQWSPMGPLGAQYGGVWDFTVIGPCAPPLIPDSED